jgi:hypothetical protein
VFGVASRNARSKAAKSAMPTPPPPAALPRTPFVGSVGAGNRGACCGAAPLPVADAVGAADVVATAATVSGMPTKSGSRCEACDRRTALDRAGSVAVDTAAAGEGGAAPGEVGPAAGTIADAVETGARGVLEAVDATLAELPAEDDLVTTLGAMAVPPARPPPTVPTAEAAAVVTPSPAVWTSSDADASGSDNVV